MKTFLNIISVTFMLLWIAGVFIFSAGILIHILLVLAIFSFIISFLSEEPV